MNNLLFLDTETTGNDLLNDRLFQVCYKINDIVHNEYFKPPLPITVKSQSITHVTNKMVADKNPFKGSKIHEHLQQLLNENILVAHNAAFDKAMLENEGMTVPKFICTLKLSRHLDHNNEMPEHGLQFLRYFLEMDIPVKAHEAEADVLVLESLFKIQYKKLHDKHGDHTKVVDEMLEISQKPSLHRVINFGKHKGKRIDEVVKSDRSYLQWLLEQKLQNTQVIDEDWIYTLKYYLQD